jgi:hypothetical protein
MTSIWMTSICWKNAVTWSLLGLMFPLLALMVGPAPALGKDLGPEVGAVLYEVVEDAKFFDGNGQPTAVRNSVVRRTANAWLSGWAELGTPLCPSEMLVVYPKAKRCALIAVGQDDIRIAVQNLDPLVITFTGEVKGDFEVVLQGDNPSDAPEAAVGIGSFKGEGDLSPALVDVPLGSISGGTGTVSFPLFGVINVPFRFTGTFRLPFSMAQDGSKGSPRPGRAAFYLNDDGHPTPVRQDERSIGWPTVRLEIKFEGR